ncbi:MAG: hypothetical protein U1A78_10925 [Polyangia bacterium]
MKKLALTLLLAAAATTASACSDKVSADDKNAAYQAVLSLAQLNEVDPDTQQRVFYRLCSELKGCAQSCTQELAACAKPDTEPSQRAVLVASCAKDYRQRRDRGEALHPDAWLKERLVRFLDKVQATLAGEEQHKFEAARAQVRLSSR